MIDTYRLHEKVSLTQRERDILNLLTNGLTDSEIAEALVLTVGTVKWYNRQVYNKLGTRNRTETIIRAQQLDLLRVNPRSDKPVPAPPHNLHAPITSFIGRNDELAKVKELVLTSRLITLTGSPGSGKTRLALEVASTLLEQYRDGVYFVSLASIQDITLLTQTIAETLVVNASHNESLLATLKTMLRNKHILLVLDNFEHLVPAAPLISDVLAAAPRLTALVTSREALRLYGEHEFSVPALELPNLSQKAEVHMLRTIEAIDLFVQRACAAQPGFVLGNDNVASVAMICARLDGLPLAIELAAARLKYYTPQTLLIRLRNRLETLSEGARDLPDRQRTLRSTIAWSYDLLSEEEKRLFMRLGVFEEGFSVEDAEAICRDGTSREVIVGLESLLNKSLLRQTPDNGGGQYFTMLGTIREFALEKLAENNELAQIG